MAVGRVAGWVLFGYFLLAIQEKVTRAPPRRTKPDDSLADGERINKPKVRTQPSQRSQEQKRPAKQTTLPRRS
jgi:hypothetical protein